MGKLFVYGSGLPDTQDHPGLMLSYRVSTEDLASFSVGHLLSLTILNEVQ